MGKELRFEIEGPTSSLRTLTNGTNGQTQNQMCKSNIILGSKSRHTKSIAPKPLIFNLTVKVNLSYFDRLAEAEDKTRNAIRGKVEDRETTEKKGGGRRKNSQNMGRKYRE